MELTQIIALHRARYPEMTPQDWEKLAFQGEYGPAHLGLERDALCRGILTEREGMEGGNYAPALPEPVGEGLYRFPLTAVTTPADAAALARCVCHTAQQVQGSAQGLRERLEKLSQLVPDLRLPTAAPNHSPEFHRAYRPRYRLILREHALYFPVISAMEGLLAGGRAAILAIDGRCGSGKSTLAGVLESLYPCNVVHMDDFYLPPQHRGEDWMQRPAGNMDLERFSRELLQPLKGGQSVRYRPYRCRTGQLEQGRVLPPAPLTVVEGSYSHHPLLREQYDLRVFLTCREPEQLRRLERRDPESFPRFCEIWKPLEERYFTAFSVEENAHLRLDTAPEWLG